MDSTAIRDSYDAVADVYAQGFTADPASKPSDHAMLTVFAEQIPREGLVADVGCGPAQVACFLADLGVPVLGFDVSPGMVEVARARRPGLDARVGSMLDLPPGDGEPAGVVAFYSLVHLQVEERPLAYAEFARVLRPGGLALAAFHAGQDVRQPDSWFDRPVALDFFAPRPEEVAAGLAAAGFAMEATLPRGPYPGEADTERAYLPARKAPGR
ncbi:class I SAM-dependent methyltransferase [Streptomyces adelaidensis]|uniref:class I SAM-dependent methyltransferase n=1 Tax=Streptomyces adelaidensis TaxID=2796465 RepID=UPI001904B6AB|nr:class I SAM-dependent methyltransferase [Streptomyces adelaidensis]